MYEDNTKVIRRVAIITAVIVIGFILFNIFNRGSLTVSIPEKGVITVENDSGVVTKKEGVEKLHAFLRPGTYKITATDESGEKSSVSIIKMKALQSKDSRLTLEKKLQSYRILNKAVSNVYSINTTLYIGIDLNRGEIKTYDNNGSYSLKYSDEDNEPINFTSLQKLNEGYFFATGEQSLPLLIHAVGTEVTGKVIYPPSTSEGGIGLATRTSDGKSFWVVSKDTAYLFDYPYEKPSKTVRVQTDSTYSNIAASRDKILFYSSAEAVADNPKRETNIVKPLIFDTNTKKKTSIDYNVVSASWSPEGTKIGLIGAESKYLSLYDTVGHKITENIDQPDSPNMYWGSKSEIYYEKENNLWRYNTSTRTGNLFADVEGTPTSITFNDKQILTTTYPDASEATLWTIPLSKPDDVLVQLSSTLPYITTDYQINYSYIGSPLITVLLTAPNNGTTPGRIALYNQRTEEAKQKATQKLSDFGLVGLPTNFTTQ